MRIAILAVPYDDADRSVGVGLGPARLLEAGLAHELREEGHDVREVMVELPDGHHHLDLQGAADTISKVAALHGEIARHVRHAVALGEFPVVLAGNCHSAVGTLAARPRGAGVVWFDAHGDFNTPETTETGMLDGMALAMATGRCHQSAITQRIPSFAPVDESRVVMVGTRDLDREESSRLDKSPIRRLPAGEIGQLKQAVHRIANPAPPIYVHLDLDVLDPAEARANRYSAPGGLSVASVTRAVESLTHSGDIFAIAVTAYDPSFDTTGNACHAAIAAIHAAVARDYDRE